MCLGFGNGNGDGHRRRRRRRRRRLVVVASSSSPRRRRRRRRRRQLFHTEMCRILLCKMQQSLLRLVRRVSPLSKKI